MINVNSFIADELATKNKYLHKALQQADDIIKILETENQRLKQILSILDIPEDNIEHDKQNLYHLI